MVHLENQFHSSCFYWLMILYLVLTCLVECKVIWYLLYKTGNELIVSRCSYWIGTDRYWIGIDFKCTLSLRYWFPSESSINAFLSLNFTILNNLFNQFVDNLFSLRVFFANTTSTFCNSIAFAWRSWSVYCMFSLFGLSQFYRFGSFVSWYQEIVEYRF